jgi:serine/threonine-protein kinase ULK/ATG1
MTADISVVQWLRARFNECYEKVEWSKANCADELPYVDKILHEEVKDTVSRSFWGVVCLLTMKQSRQAAMAELQNEFATAEAGYEAALWTLDVLLDVTPAVSSQGTFQTGSDVSTSVGTVGAGCLRDEERATLENITKSIKSRLDALKRKAGSEKLP